MRISFLLESTDLCGGVRVVFEQAEALAARGHDVRILTKDDGPDWAEVGVPVVTVAGFDRRRLPRSDVVVATFWSTVMPAMRAHRGAPVHLCQGYEGGFPEYLDRLDDIDAIYRLPLPALATHAPIAALLRERFAKDVVVVGHGIDHSTFWSAPSRPSSTPPRVLVVGMYEASVKGVCVALAALARLKRERDVRVIRVSAFPATDEERSLSVVDEYHERIAPQQMAGLYRSCDVLLATNRAAEGFGLPVLEALACGLPVAASDTATFRGFDAADGWCRFFPEGDDVAAAAAVGDILDDRLLLEGLRRRGLEVAGRYRYEHVAERMEAALLRACA